MNQATLSNPKRPIQVLLSSINGDLQVVGWDRNEITAKTDGERAELNSQDAEVRIACDGDAIIYLPRESNLVGQSVSGDADIRALSGNLKLANIGGDLQLRNVGATSLENIGGDLNLRVCDGDLNAKSVGADVSLRNVHGGVIINNVGADLYVREVGGSLSARVGADAILYLRPVADGAYNITAGADILLRLPAELDAEFELVAADDESIRLELGESASMVTGPTYNMKLGTGSAKFRLTAGGELVVTSGAQEWESAAEFDPGNRGGDFSFQSREPGIPPDLTESISRRVEEATRRAGIRTERAMRRAEEKMRAAEKRSRHMHMGVAVGRWGASVDRPVEMPRNEPISNDERLAILRMLQEKKISREEAEKLLAALEGK
jgi:hypothetical protein